MAGDAKQVEFKTPELVRARSGSLPASPAVVGMILGICGALGVAVATHYAAYRFGHDQGLGAPAVPFGRILPAGAAVAAGTLGLLGVAAAAGRKTRRFAFLLLVLALLAVGPAIGPLYHPFFIVKWARGYMRFAEYRPVFRDAMYAGCGGFALGLYALLGLSRGGGKVKASTVHGSADWGTGDEYRIRKEEAKGFRWAARLRGVPAIPSIIIGRHADGSLMLWRDPVHGVVKAPTRSGKGVSFIVPNLLMYRGNAVVGDVKKGENWFITARRRREIGQDTVALDPFRETGEHAFLGAFNPLTMIELVGKRARLARDDAALIATMLVSDEAAGDKEKHWVSEARSLWEGLILHACVVADDARGLADAMNYRAFQAALADDRQVEKLLRSGVEADEPEEDIADAGKFLDRALAVAEDAGAGSEDLAAQLGAWDWEQGAPSRAESAAPAAASAEAACGAPGVSAGVAEDGSVLPFPGWRWGDEDPEVTVGIAAAPAARSKLPPRDLLECRRLLTLEKEAFEGLLKTMLGSRHPQVARCAARFLQKDPKERSGVVSTAQSATNWLDSEPMGDVLGSESPNQVDLGKLKTGKLSVYLVLDPDRVETHAGWLRMMVTCCIQAVSRTVGKVRDKILFLLDEFPLMGRMQSVLSGVAVRGGFGVSFWMICQDISQLKETYKQAWQTLYANSAVKMCFGTQDLETAKYLSEMLGKATVFHTSGSLSQGRNYGKQGSSNVGSSESTSEVGRPLLTPREIMDLRDHEQLLFIRGSRPLLCGKPVYHADAEFAGLFDENPLEQKLAA